MPSSLRRLTILSALSLLVCGLSGCGTINERIANGMGDYIPTWAGGLPADAPPRRGTPQYDEYMKERERKRLEPASTNDATSTSSTKAAAPPLDPVH
jgi:hypothetical protein